MLNEDSDTIQVFFSYPHRDKEELKPLFRKACVKAGVLPIFADDVRMEENLVQKLHQLILSCDIVVAAITESFSAGVSFEIAYSQAIDKPVLLFVKEMNYFFLDSYWFHLLKYRSSSDLFRLLLEKLSWFKSQLTTSENVLRKGEQSKISDFLSTSLQKNVLVLGKDSDQVGLAKMERIAEVLRSNQYVPVKLRDLPEIKYLSLEDKMIRVGGLCRFIIAEDSRSSGHIDELRLCIDCQYITATVREAGIASSWMQAHYPFQYNFMNRFCYRNREKTVKDTLCESVYDSLEKAAEQAINWAENRIGTQEKYFSKGIYSNF